MNTLSKGRNEELDEALVFAQLLARVRRSCSVKAPGCATHQGPGTVINQQPLVPKRLGGTDLPVLGIEAKCHEQVLELDVVLEFV